MKTAPQCWREDAREKSKINLAANIGGRFPLNDCRRSEHTTKIFMRALFFDNNIFRGLVHFARLRTLPMASLCQLWDGRGEGGNGIMVYVTAC